MNKRPPVIENIEHLKNEQLTFAGKVVLQSPFSTIAQVKTVAGLAVRDTRDRQHAIVCCAVHRLTDLELIEKVSLTVETAGLFPYYPGFRSFRELPLLMKLLPRVKTAVDVFLCDGHGIAHPRRCGLAAHFGVTAEKPVIGCAEEPLFGEFTEPPPGIKGAYQYLRDDGEVLGVVLRTKPLVKPLFVSPGHLMDVETAGDLVLAACTKYRIPEPLRSAHQLAKQAEQA
jgi:deoxyribonuclease V